MYATYTDEHILIHFTHIVDIFEHIRFIKRIFYSLTTFHSLWSNHDNTDFKIMRIDSHLGYVILCFDCMYTLKKYKLHVMVSSPVDPYFAFAIYILRVWYWMNRYTHFQIFTHCMYTWIYVATKSIKIISVKTPSHRYINLAENSAQWTFSVGCWSSLTDGQTGTET